MSTSTTTSYSNKERFHAVAAIFAPVSMLHIFEHGLSATHECMYVCTICVHKCVRMYVCVRVYGSVTRLNSIYTRFFSNLDIWHFNFNRLSKLEKIRNWIKTKGESFDFLLILILSLILIPILIFVKILFIYRFEYCYPYLTVDILPNCRIDF